jgi:hypothetical protein
MPLSVSNFSASGPENVTIPWMALFKEFPGNRLSGADFGGKQQHSLLQAHRPRARKGQAEGWLVALPWVDITQGPGSIQQKQVPWAKCQNKWVFPVIPVNSPLNWWSTCFWLARGQPMLGQGCVCVCVWERERARERERERETVGERERKRDRESEREIKRDTEKKIKREREAAWQKPGPRLWFFITD